MPRRLRGSAQLFSHWSFQPLLFSSLSFSLFSAVRYFPVRHNTTRCFSSGVLDRSKNANESLGKLRGENSRPENCLKQPGINFEVFGLWIIILFRLKDALKNDNTKDGATISLWRAAPRREWLKGQEGFYLSNREIELCGKVTQWKGLRWQYGAPGVKPVWRAGTSPKVS